MKKLEALKKELENIMNENSIDDEEEIKKLLVINYLIENNITTIDEEAINNIISEDIERINDLKDLIDEELEEQKKDLIESQKADC